MDEIDISLEAGWEGDPKIFVDALVKARFLDSNGNGEYHIHDWEEHQPWVVHAKERSEIARRNALIRWSKEQYANGMQTACDSHTDRNAPTPTPTPIPLKPPIVPQKSDAERIKSDEVGGGGSPTKPKETIKDPKGVEYEIPKCDHQGVIDLYHEILPMMPSVNLWEGNSRKQLAARWKEQFIRRTQKGKPGGLPFWRWYFQYIRKSDFLTGRKAKTRDLGWNCSLRWLVNPTNFQKVVNGEYHSIEKKEEDD